MMHSALELLDAASVTGKSVMHRAASSKLVLLLLGMCAAFGATRCTPLQGMLVLNLLAVWVFSGVGLRPMGLLVYPLGCGLLFGSLLLPPGECVVTMLSRVAAISSTVLLTFLTTVPARMCLVTAWFLPPIINDALYCTYDTFFAVFRRVSIQMRVLRARGVVPYDLTHVPHMFCLLGSVMLNAFDDATESGIVAAYRTGGRAPQKQMPTFAAADILPVSIGITYVLMAIFI